MMCEVTSDLFLAQYKVVQGLGKHLATLSKPFPSQCWKKKITPLEVLNEDHNELSKVLPSEFNAFWSQQPSDSTLS